MLMDTDVHLIKKDSNIVTGNSNDFQKPKFPSSRARYSILVGL